MRKIALLTGTINPRIFNTPFTRLMDKIERLNQYSETIKKYILNSNFDIMIFCENSQYLVDYSHLKRLAKENNKILEIITFLGNKKEISNRGKGYGEGETIEYALKNSKFIKNENQTFYKITGRIFIKNINKIINSSSENNYFFSVGKRHCVTLFFKCTKKFYMRNFNRVYKKVDEKKGIMIEHLFYDSIIKKKEKVNYFNFYPFYQGIGGTNGKNYENTLKWLIRSLQNKLGMLKIKCNPS